MKRKVFIAFLFCIIISLGVFLFWKFYDFLSSKEEEKSNYALTPSEIKLLKDGDIILRHGYGLVSDLIVETLNEKYDISHCAILIKKNNVLKVIHSVSQTLSDFDGLQCETLASFVKSSKKNSIMVVRFKYLNDSIRSLISKKAEFYLAKKVPFDNLFDLEDTTKFYCSEFIRKVLLDVLNKDIYSNYRKNSNEHLKFSVFWDTTNFDIIVNHHNRKK